MNMLSPPGDPMLHYIKAVLGKHMERMRNSGDRGASAIELAIITAVLVGLAAAILLIIVNFAKTQGNNITNTTVPNPNIGGGGG
jgi:hypothetical protein